MVFLQTVLCYCPVFQASMYAVTTFVSKDIKYCYSPHEFVLILWTRITYVVRHYCKRLCNSSSKVGHLLFELNEAWAVHEYVKIMHLTLILWLRRTTVATYSVWTINKMYIFYFQRWYANQLTSEKNYDISINVLTGIWIIRLFIYLLIDLMINVYPYLSFMKGNCYYRNQQW